MLVDHDAVVVQRLVAAPVEFLGEQTGRVAERVGRVVDNQIVGVLLGAQEAQPVLIVYGDARVVQSLRIVGEKLAADVDEHLVRLDDVDGFDLVVVGQLARHAARRRPPMTSTRRTFGWTAIGTCTIISS